MILIWARTGDARSVSLIFIGAIIGPFMGLSYPFGLTFKVGYAITLLSSIVGLVAGLRFRQLIWGQVVTVLAIVVWFLCGMIGLGTGT